MPSPTLPLVGEARPRKTVAGRGEGLRNSFAEALGAAIDRAVTLARLTKQDVAWRMGYTDASALSRWIAGTETPQFARLFAVPALRGALVIALAELTDDIKIETTITITRKLGT